MSQQNILVNVAHVVEGLKPPHNSKITVNNVLFSLASFVVIYIMMSKVINNTWRRSIHTSVVCVTQSADRKMVLKRI